MADRILKQLLHGQGAHADPLACLLGIDATIAGRRLTGVEHTIWQLTWHMNYWMDYEIRSISGPEPPYPVHAHESWPREAAPDSDAAWDAEVSRFRSLVDRLGAMVRPSLADGAARIVHAAKGETVTDVLWQMVAHNSYHTGQIAMLRRAFGHWPPPGGGDTW